MKKKIIPFVFLPLILKKLLRVKSNFICIMNEHIFLEEISYKDIYNLYVYKKLKTKVLECLKTKELIYIHLSIDTIDGGHSNSVLIQKKDTQVCVERYEPHGYSCSDSIDMALKLLFKHIFKDTQFKLKYYFNKNINCKIGTQTYSKDNIGYCTAVSVLYVLDRLKYPELSRQQITRLHKSKPPEVVLNEIKILHDKLADIFPKLPFIEKKIYVFKDIFNYNFNFGYSFVGFVKDDLFLYPIKLFGPVQFKPIKKNYFNDTPKNFKLDFSKIN